MIELDWEKGIKDYMFFSGWTLDRDDETTLGFSQIDGEEHWIRDYNKKTRRFVQFNGNQEINIRMKDESNNISAV
jgi:hypothetical protein